MLAVPLSMFTRILLLTFTKASQPSYARTHHTVAQRVRVDSLYFRVFYPESLLATNWEGLNRTHCDFNHNNNNEYDKCNL